jgi:hypothetical protein
MNFTADKTYNLYEFLKKGKKIYIRIFLNVFSSKNESTNIKKRNKKMTRLGRLRVKLGIEPRCQSHSHIGTGDNAVSPRDRGSTGPPRPTG